MRIRAFNIDSFGILNQLGQDNLPSSLAIFLGNNEAGKSTLLDFFRSTLLGYPNKPKDLREKSYLSLSGNASTAGGSLLLETDQGLWRLTRRPNALPMLSDFKANPLDIQQYERLLAGISREVYTSIYGFSLTELQNFASLNSEGVRNALYGASFGQGLRSPGQALKKIEAMLEALFKPGGSRPIISGHLRDLEQVQKEIKQAENSLIKYDDYSVNLKAQQNLLSQQTQAIEDLEHELRLLQRRISIWDNWENWALHLAKLHRLEFIASTFPEDGAHRLERALEKLSSNQQAVQHISQLQAQTQAHLASLQPQLGLLNLAPDLKNLAEHKASYRQALGAVPQLNMQIDRLNIDSAELLAQLGSQWTIERVLSTPRPLEQRENINRLATQLQTEQVAVDLNKQNLTRLNQELCGLIQEISQAQQEFANLPVPIADLATTDREVLQAQLQRTKDSLQALPVSEQNLSQARAEFNRALIQLHLQPKQNTAQTLDELNLAQGEISQQAHLALQAKQDLTQIKQLQNMAQDAEVISKKRLDRLQNQREDLGDPNRQIWEKHRVALRNLRQIMTNVGIEAEKLQEAQDRYNDHLADAPKPDHGIWLVALGLLIASAGGAIIAARKILGLTSLDIIPEFSLPLELWLGYGILAGGVCFIAAGWPRKHPEILRHAALSQRLEGLVQNFVARLHDLRTEQQNLCAFLDLTAPSSAELDAVETQLQALRDNCAADERLQQELQLATLEYENLHQNSVQQTTNLAKQTAELNSLRRHWHEHLQDFGLSQVPLPENIDTFFARVESARMLWQQVQNQEKEVSTLQNQATLLKSVSQELLPKAAWPESFKDLPQVIAAGQAIIDSCHKADLAAEARTKAELALQNLCSTQNRLEQMLEQETIHQGQLTSQLQATQTRWQEVLQDLGLNPGFSVNTAQEALQIMDQVLHLHKENINLHDALHKEEQSLKALENPLQTLLCQLQQPLPENPDYLQILANLDHDLEQNQAQAAQKAQALQKLLEQDQEIRRLTALQQDAQQQLDWLLKMAEATDPEDFLRKFNIKSTKDALHQIAQQLEDSLRLAWNSPPFNAQSFEGFIDTFSNTAKTDVEARLQQVQAQLLNLKEAKQQTEKLKAELHLHLDLLSQNNTLPATRQQELNLVNSINSQAKNWASLMLAKDLLLTARHNFEKSKQPEVIRQAANIFSKITQGKWINIQASLEDSSLRVVSPQGEPLAPELLSRGTQEQLYLALRLAHIQHQNQHLPIIMDDILVNFDPKRAKQTAITLNDICQNEPKSEFEPTDSRSSLAPNPNSHLKPSHKSDPQLLLKTPAQQILFFTCHPHLADLLQQNVADSVIYRLDQGKIQLQS